MHRRKIAIATTGLMTATMFFCCAVFAGGSEALIEAARRGNLMQVQELLKNGPDLDGISRRDHHSALTAASEKGHFDILALLLDAGVDVNARTTRGFTAVTSAYGRGHKQVVEFLKARGAKR